MGTQHMHGGGQVHGNNSVFASRFNVFRLSYATVRRSVLDPIRRGARFFTVDGE